MGSNCTNQGLGGAFAVGKRLCLLNAVKGFPQVGEAEMVASGGVDEGSFAIVGLGGNESGDVYGVFGWQRNRFAFAVES